MHKIHVTKSFLPSKEVFFSLLEDIWESRWLTNNGPLTCTLERELETLLDVRHCHFVTNGTIALQLALHSLGITSGEVITTPFSYVATVSSILWERCTPVFVDIHADTMCIDPDKIEAAITPRTKAIMPVHVFGYPCDVRKIEEIAQQYGLKVIYDGAHGFLSRYHGRSLLSYGDASVCSFHATKLFHTVEGGCVITNDSEVHAKLELIKRFGHIGDDHYSLGINGKNSELHAAMGIANLPHCQEILAERKRLCFLYDSLLEKHVARPASGDGLEYNYAYYPVIFESERQLCAITELLNQHSVYPRRYFYPSLNTLPYVEYKPMSVSEDISSRILCLPLYPGLEQEDVQRIANLIIRGLNTCL